MTQPSRPRTRGAAQRRRRTLKINQLELLETRQLLAPYVVTSPITATFTAATTPTNADLGTVSITSSTATGAVSAAPLVSVGELTPISQFGNDIVQIAAGPGGAFGNGIYAISRGAGDNASIGAINRPGVIYRVDPATGKASVFFDLNTVINQIEPGGNAGNSMGASTGLVNWYSITFDPNGYFDGTPSMFVASVDKSDPNKNVIYQISPSGQFLGAFVIFSNGQSAQQFTSNPTAIMVPPTDQQSFLRGLISAVGGTTTAQLNNPAVTGITPGSAPPTLEAPSTTLSGAPQTVPGNFTAVFFNSNEYQPGQNISSTVLPFGVIPTNFTLGPIVGLTAANAIYGSPDYSAFTDFGTPAAGGIPAQPGLSGVQGSNGELLIQNTTGATAFNVDSLPAAPTSFRRFESIAFDQYGYFSYGATTATTAGAGGTGGTGTGGTGGIAGSAGVTGAATVTPTYVGSMFVADLGTGLSVPVTPLAPLPTTTIEVPIQGPGTVGVTTDAAGNVVPIVTNGNTTDGSNIGGRIVRISPEGQVTTFAAGFATSGAQDATSFINSSLSITFSASGTTLYAADDNAIWQFKAVTDLANSTAGSIIGLNDLQTLGVPYDGTGSAIAVLDTGVDGNATPFQGHVALGTNVYTNGLGNTDTAAGVTTSATGTAAGAGFTGGHGTPVAGVIAQFVPQATIVPVNVFAPFITGGSSTTGTTTGTAAATLGATTNTAIYKGLQYVNAHPFVANPLNPSQFDRVIAANFGFGTVHTFNTEAMAFRKFPQLTIAFKTQLHQMRNLGIVPIAPAGQFGTEYGSQFGNSTAGAGGTGAASTAGAGTVGDFTGMSFPAVLNEVVSVTGTYPFPFLESASTPPTDPSVGALPTPLGPALLGFGLGLGGSGSSTGGAGGTTTAGAGGAAALTAGNLAIYSDELLASANRSSTTDYAAPALDIPTFSRNSVANSVAASTTATGTAAGTALAGPLVFTDAGTSLATAMVTGSFALVSSALNYWINLNQTGYTDSAYLNMPVGTRTLNFGPNAFKDLRAYANPDGVNAILQWTAVPAYDVSNGLVGTTTSATGAGGTAGGAGTSTTGASGVFEAPPSIYGTNDPRAYSRISVSNAIAAIEGDIAINWLLKHNVLPLIDTNHSGLITAQDIQNFVDNAASMGMPEAGAMAALLGGTGAAVSAGTTEFGTGTVSANGTNGESSDQPDSPAALQRRFNFFDYAANGSLKGAIPISAFPILARTLLPPPDAFRIIDRQASSGNGYLIAPTAQRDYKNLQHLLPTYVWVPKSALVKYRNVSPAAFGIGKGLDPLTNSPRYTLFDVPNVIPSTGGNTLSNGSSGSSSGSGTGTSASTGSGSSSGAGGTSGSNVIASTNVGTSSNTSTTTPSTATSTTSTPTTSSTSTTSATSTLPAQSPTIVNVGSSTMGSVTPITNSGSGSTSSTSSTSNTSSNPAVSSVNSLLNSLGLPAAAGTITPASSSGSSTSSTSTSSTVVAGTQTPVVASTSANALPVPLVSTGTPGPVPSSSTETSGQSKPSIAALLKLDAQIKLSMNAPPANRALAIRYERGLRALAKEKARPFVWSGPNQPKPQSFGTKVENYFKNMFNIK